MVLKMKPEELLEYCGERLYARVEAKRIIDLYYNQDCVIAYDKNKLGVIFIIKGKTKYFGFVSLKEGIYLGGQEYIFGRIDLKKVLSLLGDDCKILNKEEFSKVKKEIIVENL